MDENVLLKYKIHNVDKFYVRTLNGVKCISLLCANIQSKLIDVQHVFCVQRIDFRFYAVS